MNTKKLTVIEITSITQYIDGARWLRENVGHGKIWTAPPENPFKSRMHWWAKGYPNKYVFWIKDPKMATMFRLTLPSPRWPLDIQVI
jgi:hypothetical protein